MQMLRAERFQLFSEVDGDHVTGVVKSQTDSSLFYACKIDKSGRYMCCTQNLNVCGGLRGKPCKHLLVLMVGLVKSQTDPSLFYACKIDKAGSFMCCTQNLFACGGLRGKPCKHLLVLMVGLVQAGGADAGLLSDWAAKAKGKKPALDKDAMSATFIKYKGAEAGEIDWRPTETIPEDYYAL